uniref:MATH domain-containing protein n=1 Tax=Globodera rostochiensis TaxID=31243 RepID=A0A914GYS7_GLORO
MKRLSTTSGDQAKDNTFKRCGQIVFRMPNIKEFSEGHGPKEVLSDAVEYINGLPWRIEINHCDAYIGLYLHCDGDQKRHGLVLSCYFSRQHCFLQQNWGYEHFVEIEELLDSKNGLYDEKEDAVTFKVEVITEEGMPGVRLEDVLRVNEEVVCWRQ